MSTVYEQSDGFIPNKQTPPTNKQIGTAADPWTEVKATRVHGITEVSGATVYVGAGAHQAAKVYSATVDFVANTAKTVTHSLVNSNPLVQVYGSGTNQQFMQGSGIASPVITAISGIDGNNVSITVSAAAPGSTVIIIG